GYRFRVDCELETEMVPVDQDFSIKRTPVHFHWSLALFPLLLLGLDAIGAREARGLGVEVLFGLCIFGSIALHEIGHVVAARWVGIQARSITLHVIGGHARLARQPRSGREELIVALAGPAVNFAIAAALLTLVFSGLTQGTDIVSELAALNLAIALFNMLPLFPLDGGRALRAGLSLVMGHVPATTLAASVGIMLSAALILLSFSIEAPVVGLVALALAFASYVEGKAVLQQFAPAPERVRGPQAQAVLRQPVT
ncbi:MAG: site-2 protease family protein, partial [Pseudomonadota bacterium]